MVSLVCGLLVGERTANAVHIDANELVGFLKDIIKAQNRNRIKCDASDLKLYLAMKNGRWFPMSELQNFELKSLSEMTLMDSFDLINKYFGRDFQPGHRQIHVFVVAPPPSFPGQATFLPAHFNSLMEECIRLPNWKAGTMHEIPSIWEFMKAIGGCTSFGRILWRLEEKMVLSNILADWRKASPDENSLENMDLRSIVSGSPGSGNSTMLGMIVFYIYFRYKTNVLFYRRVTVGFMGNCLLYLGYENGEPLHCVWEQCSFNKATNVQHELVRRHGAGNVSLCLDGFVYKKIPYGLDSFTLLSTSQDVFIKLRDTDITKMYLLPCWSKKDLFWLGKTICGFSSSDMEKRYAISGSSVRDFTWRTVEKIKEKQQLRPNQCQKPIPLHAVTTALNDYGTEQTHCDGILRIDGVFRTYVRNVEDPSHYTNPEFWMNVIDSEYLLESEAMKMHPDWLLSRYHWAKGVGLYQLAGLGFEYFIHSLASCKTLSLFISEYSLKRRRGDSECSVTERLHIKRGRIMQKGTKNDYERCLLHWRDDENLTYWIPSTRDFPNIDSIVKFTSSSGESIVAYLQITVDSEQRIDLEQLKKLNAIFMSDGNCERPFYIAVCPDQEACEALILKKNAEIREASMLCLLFVGCIPYDEVARSLRLLPI